MDGMFFPTGARRARDASVQYVAANNHRDAPFSHTVPFRKSGDPLARVFDACGFERCLWGTDWTRAFAVVKYEQAVEPFRLTDRLSDSEQAMLMGGACAKAYGWSPKPGKA